MIRSTLTLFVVVCLAQSTFQAVQAQGFGSPERYSPAPGSAMGPAAPSGQHTTAPATARGGRASAVTASSPALQTTPRATHIPPELRRAVSSRAAAGLNGSMIAGPAIASTGPHASLFAPTRNVPHATTVRERELVDNQDDPAYSSYKEGYNLILEEKWDDAKKKLSKVISGYPKSEYRDDAEYWYAYALMHLNTKDAIKAYSRFVENFPKSSYYDDAVADLNQLKSDVIVITPDGSAKQVYVGGDGYTYSFTSDSTRSVSATAPIRASAREMRKLTHELQSIRGALTPFPPFGPLHLAPMLSTPFFDDEKLDPDTRLKLDALYAIGDTKEDEKSFQALKDVALDFNQHERLRYAALDIISNFKKYDVMPVYTEIARRDTNQQMQSYAIDYISNHTKDKNQSVLTLIELFNGTPKSRTEQRRRLFYAIAEVGNDRAVEFLASVARTNENYDLRREAVYYLGTIGSEKSRTELYGILRGK